MLDKLTRYIRGFGPPSPARPGSNEPMTASPDTRPAGSTPPGLSRPPAGALQDGWTVRDLVVEGAVAPALREVFAQERSRSGSGQVITLYDPQRAFAPVLPRLVEALRGAAGDRIRLIDSRSRKALAVIDRAQLGTAGNVLRLLEVDISGAERPSPEVPLTLLEQSDVGAVLLGPQPDPTLLESLLMASLAPTWRCTSLLLVVPQDASTARARLARYTWPTGTRTEPISDPVADLPALWTTALRRAASAPAGADAATHVDRISQMLAAVAAPPAARPAGDAALSDTTVPAARPLAAAVSQAARIEPTLGPATRPEPQPAATRQDPQPAATRQEAPATLPPRSFKSLAREPGTDAPMPAPTQRPDTDRTPTPARAAKATPEPALPQRSLAPGEQALQTLEPLMRLPGAIAAAVVDLRDARMLHQLGAVGALAGSQAALMLGCKPLITTPPERSPRVDEWIWTAGGRQHVLQPLPRDPCTAVLVVVDADRADLAMTRWSCTVARNAIDQQPAAAAPAGRTETAVGASSGH
jgi:hypothetical protein